MIYPKINSLWKRQEWYLEGEKKHSWDYQHGRQSFIIGDYAQEEFGLIKYWHVEEKIDGTNIRIIFKEGSFEIKGREENSKVPQSILDYLIPHLNSFKNLITDNLILFGEGYGPKIQEGSNYRNDVSFLLFDVFRNGKFEERKEVYKLADQLEFPKPYVFGIMTEEEIIKLVESKIPSPSAINKNYMMEGIIARTTPILRSNESGDVISWKLKCKEFK